MARVNTGRVIRCSARDRIETKIGGRGRISG